MKKSFIHCADIHLGRQQFNSDQRWSDFGVTLKNIIDTSVEKKVDYILLSGDFFHERVINAKTLSLSTEILSKAKNAGIDIIAIEGNHDKAPYKDGQSWLEYLDKEGYIKLLYLNYDENGDPLMTQYENGCGNMLIYDDLRIIGLGYLGASTPKRINQIKEAIGEFNGFTIVMLHAAVDTLLGQSLGGFKGEILKEFNNVDYFALGHIHSRYEGENWYNPGAPEYVHLDEAKTKNGIAPQKGYYYVTLEDKKADINFIESTKRRVIYKEIDLCGYKSADEVKICVLSQVSQYMDKEAILYARLSGELDFSPIEIDIYSIQQEISNPQMFFYCEIVNMCTLKGIKNEEINIELDKNEIERVVFKMMLNEKYPNVNFEAGIEDFIVSIKDNVLSGEEPENIAQAIQEYALRADKEVLLNED